MYKGIGMVLIMLGTAQSIHAISNSANMNELSDSQLSEVTGQALMSLTYIAPTDAANLESKRTGANNIGFYKLGMEAELELNANIKKLQLGCGGVNGAGGCDIDIDHLSLSGDSSTRDGRASSSAKLTNPFMEFAIKNPNSASTREIVGLRLSSEKAQGMITFGQENSDTPNGINSLSGYMEVASTVGTAKVNPYFNLTPDKVGGAQISGLASGTKFTTTKYDLNLTADGVYYTPANAANAPKLMGNLVLNQQAITGKRISSTILKATANVSNIKLTGDLTAQVWGFINLGKQADGVINNLGVDVTINENLGLFHKANLNGTSASLSLQAQNILWPSTKSVAQNGWWLEFSDPIDIGRIDPINPVDIASNTIKDSLAEVSKYLSNPKTQVECGWAGLLSCLGGDPLKINVDLKDANKVPMDLVNITMINQSFAPNCYGSLKFC